MRDPSWETAVQASLSKTSSPKEEGSHLLSAPCCFRVES